LDFCDTQVSDLAPLEGLPHLSEIKCLNTPVSDFSPLSRIPSLHRIVCDDPSSRRPV
jgi:hypothetical protein